MSDILAEMQRLLVVTIFGSSIEECWLSSDLISFIKIIYC